MAGVEEDVLVDVEDADPFFAFSKTRGGRGGRFRTFGGSQNHGSSMIRREPRSSLKAQLQSENNSGWRKRATRPKTKRIISDPNTAKTTNTTQQMILGRLLCESFMIHNGVLTEGVF